MERKPRTLEGQPHFHYWLIRPDNKRFRAAFASRAFVNRKRCDKAMRRKETNNFLQLGVKLCQEEGCIWHVRADTRLKARPTRWESDDG